MRFYIPLGHKSDHWEIIQLISRHTILQSSYIGNNSELHVVAEQIFIWGWILEILDNRGDWLYPYLIHNSRWKTYQMFKMRKSHSENWDRWPGGKFSTWTLLLQSSAFVIDEVCGVPLYNNETSTNNYHLIIRNKTRNDTLHNPQLIIKFRKQMRKDYVDNFVVMTWQITKHYFP